MKKLYILFTVTALVLASCSAKEESPNPATKKDPQQNNNTGGGNTGGGNTGGGNTGGGNTTQPNLTLVSEEQFWGKIDGTILHMVKGQAGITTVSANEFTPSTTGGQSAVIFSAGLADADDNPSIYVDKGTLMYTGDAEVPMMEMTPFFVTNPYPYSIDAAAGIQIYYYDNMGMIYSTSYGSGDQTGSNFEITAMSPHADGAKVVMKFNCKLHSILGSQELELTEGIMVLNYENVE